MPFQKGQVPHNKRPAPDGEATGNAPPSAMLDDDPLALAARDEAVLSVDVQDFNEGEVAQNPFEKLLPAVIADVPVVYRWWNPDAAPVAEALYPYARAVTRDGSATSPPFSRWLPDSAFAGGQDYVQNKQVSGCLYHGDLMCFWVPAKTVKQMYERARRISDGNLKAIMRGSEKVLDAQTPGEHHSRVQVNKAQIATADVTVD